LFTTQNRENFTDLQKNIIESEFRFQLEQADVDIEKFEIEDNYFTILMLVPFDVNIKSILQAAINECNQYGNFLDTKFLFTNVKILSEEEIANLLKKKD
jgi:REP element-mobilizing transposase RayT